jgi:hypothetical protein
MAQTRSHEELRTDRLALYRKYRAEKKAAERDSYPGPEAVVLTPAGASGWAIDQNWLARANEADWRISSPTGRTSAPRYACQRTVAGHVA